MPFTPPTSGALIGMTEAQLRAYRTRLQTALIELVASDQPVKLSYAQGDGNRMVEYRSGDEASIRSLIVEITRWLGDDVTGGGRRAIRVRFA